MQPLAQVLLADQDLEDERTVPVTVVGQFVQERPRPLHGLEITTDVLGVLEPQPNHRRVAAREHGAIPLDVVVQLPIAFHPLRKRDDGESRGTVPDQLQAPGRQQFLDRRRSDGTADIDVRPGDRLAVTQAQRRIAICLFEVLQDLVERV